MQPLYSYAPLYEAYDRVQAERARALNTGVQAMNPLERFMHSRASGRSRDGFARIQACREALDALDRRGWFWGGLAQLGLLGVPLPPVFFPGVPGDSRGHLYPPGVVLPDDGPELRGREIYAL